MVTLTARQIIKKEYGTSKNFMTDQVLGYWKITRNSAVELSRGWFIDHWIYGVSFVEYDPSTGKTERNTDLSNAFANEQDARNYIAELKRDCVED